MTEQIPNATAEGLTKVLGALVSVVVVASCTPEFASSGGASGAGGSGGSADSGSAGAEPAGGAGAGAPGGSSERGGSPGASGDPGVTEAGSGGQAGEGAREPDLSLVPQQGLVLWLRAERGVTEVNGAVSEWLDSAAQLVARQTATNQRPKLVQGALAGKPALVFDGQNDYLKLPTLAADLSRGVSIIYAGWQGAKECQSIFEASNGSELDDVHLGSWQGYPLYEVMDSFLHSTDYPVVPEEPEVLMGIQQSNGAVRLRRNTFGLGERSFSTPENVSRGEVFIGHGLYPDCGYFAGAIGELLIYGRALGDSEVVGLETYLQQKWGCCTE